MIEPNAIPTDAALQPLSPFSLPLRRSAGPVVGRPVELASIGQELEAARGGLVSLTLEGEPGIGKTRLLLAAADLANEQGFTSIAVSADEELRGPFLLARSILASPEAQQAAVGTDAAPALQRALAVTMGKAEPGLESLPPDERLLRTYDLGASALQALAAIAPLALLIDDAQWADDDSLRMLRYTVRADAASPIFLMLTVRPEEFAFVTEAVNLVADMERLGLVRRLRLARFTQLETAELLRNALGGPVNPSSAATAHAQAEGVPFIIEELARAYREAGMVQQIDGVWTLAKNAERLVPSAVRTLIQRRVARLPEETKLLLAEAAVVGRSFSLRDLRNIKHQLGEDDGDPDALEEKLAPAVGTGLLLEHPQGSAADYSFTHEQVREFAVAGLSTPRRRAIHGAIVAMLTADGDPPEASLGMLAHHAIEAGDVTACSRFAIEAARTALAASAPEEVLRVVELALPATSAAGERVSLLRARDEALDMLRRAGDRLEGLAELSALAEALGDSHLELEVMLRRAAAFRLSDEPEAAAQLARRVRELAAEGDDPHAQLSASLELGQGLLRSGLGEGFTYSPKDADLDGAEEAYREAVSLAERVGDERSLAAALRELGTISVSRIRAWFVERVFAGETGEYFQRIAAGETIDQILPSLPIAGDANEGGERFQRALEIYERLGERRGVMSTIIGMAYLTWGADIHLPGSVKRIEEIRKLHSRFSSLTKESERALADAQMTYGVHVYARAKVFPDLALARGQEAYQQGRVLGDRALEFAAAGGVALAHLDLGEVGPAEEWLDRAAAVATGAPTPFRSRQLAVWRGMSRAAAGDAAGLREQFERAVGLATDAGRPADRCEVYARMALSAARLGAEQGDEGLLALAEEAARDADTLVAILPGHPPWGAEAAAARAVTALARGDAAAAAASAGSAMQSLQEGLHEDTNLHILLPAARAIFAGGPEEVQREVRGYLQTLLTILAQRILDDDIRVRWFRGPLGRELTDLAGSLEGMDTARAASGNGQTGAEVSALGSEELRLLELLVEGKTNLEIAKELAVSEAEVAQRMAHVFGKINASSRAEATAFAMMGRLV